MLQIHMSVGYEDFQRLYISDIFIITYSRFSTSFIHAYYIPGNFALTTPAVHVPVQAWHLPPGSV